MIYSVNVRNYIGEELPIVLSDGEPYHGLIITNISGISSTEGQLNITDYATIDGGIFNSARLHTRTIDITLRFTPALTIEDARHVTYKFFPVKKPVTLTFVTDTRKAEITGYTRYNNVNIFSEAESATITIECADPYFYEVSEGFNPHVTNFSAIESDFEFPFSNESLTENLIEFSRLMIRESQEVPYIGDAPTGVLMRILVKETSIGDITISNDGTGEVMKIYTSKIRPLVGGYLRENDEIQVSTVKRERHARLLRNGVYTNILNAIDKQSDWFLLNEGNNMFSYSVANGGELGVTFTIENRIVYEGV